MSSNDCVRIRKIAGAGKPIMAIYGSIGYCEFGDHKKVRLHAKIGGKIACMRCYADHRYANDPVYREKQKARMLAYVKKNKKKVYAYNNAYNRRRLSALKKNS